jgi:hypothetical protein
MRSVILLFFLIITLCNRFGRSQQQQQQQTNFERPVDNPSLEKSKSKVKPIGGQRELYIPSYSSPQLLQRPQEFVYPNNFRNAYQYSQYKYTNRVPDIVNQRQWSSGPTLRNSIDRNYRYENPAIYDSSVDSISSEFNSESNKDFQYQRPEKFILRQNINQNNDDINRDNRLKQKLTDSSLKSKAKDFNDEQQRLIKTKVMSAVGHELKDENNNNRNANTVSDLLFGPVMRRKSATNVNSMQTSALHASDHKSIPVPLARQQGLGSQPGSLGDVYFVAIVACVSAVAIFGVIGAGICVYKVQQSNKAAADVDYPAYGVVGPASKENNVTGTTSPSGDRKLAQSAQMYHYHHQKQQMIASEKAVTNRRNSASDVESDEENEEGEYTVYECPGLAPTGEMEVKNPLFHDDITPVSSPSVTGITKEK